MAIEKVRRNGSYAPLSATYYQDDDIAEAGEAAELLFLRGLAFCAGRPSDGFMSDAQVVRFVGVGMRDAMDRAARLAAVGLWERVEGGFIIRAWLKWNKSAEELGQYRASDRDRKAIQQVVGDDIKVTYRYPGPAPDPDSDSARNTDRNGDRNPSGVRAEEDAESDRIAGEVDEEPETGTEGDKQAEEIPRGLRSESDAHYTALHDTSLHTHSSDERTTESATDSALFGTNGHSHANGKATKTTPRKRASPNVDQDPFFVAFWTAYPRKVDKGHARTAWASKVKAGAEPQAVVDGAVRFRNDPARPTEDRFIPHPSTWLNGERWNDKPAEASAVRRRLPPWEN